MLTLKGVFVDRWMMQVYPSQRVLRVFSSWFSKVDTLCTYVVRIIWALRLNKHHLYGKMKSTDDVWVSHDTLLHLICVGVGVCVGVCVCVCVCVCWDYLVIYSMM